VAASRALQDAAFAVVKQAIISKQLLFVSSERITAAGLGFLPDRLVYSAPLQRNTRLTQVSPYTLALEEYDSDHSLLICAGRSMIVDRLPAVQELIDFVRSTDVFAYGRIDDTFCEHKPLVTQIILFMLECGALEVL
jgi:hypothetical protein